MAQLARVATRMLVLFVILFVASVGQASAEETVAPYTGRWVDVNLSTLRITAFQAGKAAYSAPVTTGKAGYRTPTGTFYIIQRFRVQDMRSANGAALPYFQPNVEFIQYFYFPGGYALHANYWQPVSVFGRVNASHGCVGMLRGAAMYFWGFANVGTPVHIHYGKTTSASPVATVSSVVGKDQSSAQAALKADGFKVAVKPTTTMLELPGTVLTQSAAANQSATKGSTVTLSVAAARPRAEARPPEGDFAWAPDVIGLTEAEAVARIEQVGLKPTYVNYYDDDSVPAPEKSALQRVRKGAVFAQLTDSGQIRLRGGEYAISVRRDLGSPSTSPSSFVVANTGGLGVNLRRSASTKSARLRIIPEGTIVVATGPSVSSGGSVWYPVRDDRGTSGWVQARYLAVLPSSQR